MIYFKKAVTACALALSLACTAGFGGTMGMQDDPKSELLFYFGLLGGYSMSPGDAVQPYTTPGQSIITAENSPWDKSIGNAGMAGLFVGFDMNPNIGLLFNYAYRGNYQWRVDAALTSALPITYEYYKAKTNIQTFMFDLVLKPNVEWGSLKPYIKGGLGWARNHFGHLENIDNLASFQFIYQRHTEHNFAWEAGTGINYTCDNGFGIGIHYQFVDTGVMTTGQNLSLSTFTGVGLVNRFSARHVFLHEVFASISYQMDVV